MKYYLGNALTRSIIVSIVAIQLISLTIPFISQIAIDRVITNKNHDAIGPIILTAFIIIFVEFFFKPCSR